MLFAGRYLSQGYNGNDTTLTIVANKHYFDYNPNATQTYSLKYKGNLNDDQFKTNSYKEYVEGTLSIVSKDNINESDLTQLSLDQDAKGIFYIKAFNTLNAKFKALPNITPNIFEYEEGTTESAFSFNDNYSKLMYGLSRNELIAGTSKSADLYKKLYAGYGVKLRTLINAAIN
ncbi:UNVERIFIED_CONTAM: hypothetical protein O8I53_09650 [Campylobacter lari]